MNCIHSIYVWICIFTRCKFIIETDTPYDELNNVIIKETKTVLLTFDYMIVVYFYLAASICIDFVRQTHIYAHINSHFKRINYDDF